MKKIISLILALCLMLSMALTATAAKEDKPVYLVLGDEIAAGEDLKDGELSFGEKLFLVLFALALIIEPSKVFSEEWKRLR